MTDKKVSASEPKKVREAKAVEAKREGRTRPTRITRDLLVNKGPLVVPESVKKTGFVNFWMKDEPHKFEKYSRLGYDFVVDSNGSKISVGRQGEVMYLLEIPKELHDQIKALKKELKLERTQEIQGINKPRQQGDTERIFEDRLVVK